MSDRLKAQLTSFADVWRGGYYEGDPLEPLSRSSYAQLGYISVIRATYLRCVKPYISAQTVALELGAGQGAWTKSMLAAREVWALDAKTAEDNQFWRHLGQQPHVRYQHVTDYSCAALPDDYFTYLFSFGCLCHLPFEAVELYARNLFPKLRSGTNAFWMVADYDKYNRLVKDWRRHSVWSAAAPAGRRFAPFRAVLRLLMRVDGRPAAIDPDLTDESIPGRWYDAGIERTCQMLGDYHYEVLDRDVETSLRDPIIHFRKP